MKLLPGLRRTLQPPTLAHQGGWDEIFFFFVIPVLLFVFLRYLGVRRERREQAEGKDDSSPPT